ncbi:MAG: response regulator, partial [Candidatus Sumerlaeota bacterium]
VYNPRQMPALESLPDHMENLMVSILLIEDDSQVRQMLRLTLEADGYEVQTASNGHEGMALYRSMQPDILITDLVMPQQEGIETIDKVRQLDPEANIIAISGGGTIQPHVYLDIARQLGANRTFKKPVDSRQLLKAIEELAHSG